MGYEYGEKYNKPVKFNIFDIILVISLTLFLTYLIIRPQILRNNIYQECKSKHEQNIMLNAGDDCIEIYIHLENLKKYNQYELQSLKNKGLVK